jgi:hypothetical protein
MVASLPPASSAAVSKWSARTTARCRSAPCCGVAPAADTRTVSSRPHQSGAREGTARRDRLPMESPDRNPARPGRGDFVPGTATQGHYFSAALITGRNLCASRLTLALTSDVRILPANLLEDGRRAGGALRIGTILLSHTPARRSGRRRPRDFSFWAGSRDAPELGIKAAARCETAGGHQTIP